jgi:hypothetical protein
MVDSTDSLPGTVASGIVEVVSGESDTTALAKKAAGRDMPKWEAEARARVRAAIRRFARPLSDLIARDANEGDPGCW